MQIIKGRFGGIIVVLLILAVILVVWRAGYTRGSRNSSITLSEFFEQNDSEGLSLTIYFLDPNTHFRFPLSVAYLTGDFHQYRITVQGVRQEDNLFYLLNRLANVELIPVESEPRIDARIHYVFRTENGQDIFNVTMWGWGSSSPIVVNGRAVEKNNIFLEVIKPFLPINALSELERYLYRGR